jgi:O-antigen ligase
MINLYHKLIGRKGNQWFDLYLSCVLIASLSGFLSVKGLTNICLFLLLFSSLFFIKQGITFVQERALFNITLPIIITLALPIMAILISQLGRHDWVIKSFDGPSRMFFAIPILFLFIYKKVNFSHLIALTAAPALWLIALSVYQHPELRFQEVGRFSTPFVRPNAFGTYTAVLTSFCLFHLTSPSKPSKLWFIYQALGLLVGLTLVIGSGTRGSWIALPVITFIWLLFNYRSIRAYLPWLTILIAIAFFFSSSTLSTYINNRFIGAYQEISNWINHSDTNTSTGIRLSMWKISWQLFLHNPLFGYGNKGYTAFLNEPWFSSSASHAAKEMLACCGAHNELFANTLRSGITGLVSALLLFVTPFLLFIKHVKHTNTTIATAAQLGLAYIICVAICGISIEVFNLKYLSSFYGLIVAGLSAQIIHERSHL